jgi:hypothetical protein
MTRLVSLSLRHGPSRRHSLNPPRSESLPVHSKPLTVIVGPSYAFPILGIPMVVVGLLAIAFIPRTVGRTLEEVNEADGGCLSHLSSSLQRHIALALSPRFFHFLVMNRFTSSLSKQILARVIVPPRPL